MRPLTIIINPRYGRPDAEIDPYTSAYIYVRRRGVRLRFAPATFIDRRRDDNSSCLSLPRLNYPPNVPWTIIGSRLIREMHSLCNYTVRLRFRPLTASAIFPVLKRPRAIRYISLDMPHLTHTLLLLLLLCWRLKILSRCTLRFGWLGDYDFIILLRTYKYVLHNCVITLT